MKKLTRKCTVWAAALLMMGAAGCKDGAVEAPKAADAPVASDDRADLTLDELREYIASQEDVAAQALVKAKASHGAGEPALWTLKDDDTTIHMLGTVHLLRPDVEWLTPDIEMALEQADTVVFEADITSEAAATELMSFVSSKAMFSDGTRLNDLLSDAEEEIVSEAFEDVNMSLELVQTFKPWFASITLQQMKMMSDGFDPEAGVEAVIQARVPGKTFGYLETVDQQLGRIAGLPDDDQIDFLILSAGSSADSGEMLDDLVEEWSDGDVNGLTLLIGDADAFGSEAVYDAFLKSRNEDWVPQIEGMLDAPGTTFVAVGAAHLVGPDSVVQMLRSRGHAVTGP